MAHSLPLVVSTFVIPMLKITRVTDTGTTTLIVSGRIQAEQLPDLRRSVEGERAGSVVLDLSEVTLVDGDVVRFLLQCEMQGIRLAQCPAYVREWMTRDK
jgi:anti-anti-sigma regulatory factor